MSENINVCLFSYPSRPKILNSDFLLFLSFPDCIGITGSLLPMWCRMNHCCFYATKRGKPFQKCPANTHKCAVSNWTRMMWKPLIKFVNHLVCAIVPTLFYPVHRTDSYLHTHWYASGTLVQHPSFLSCFHFLFILVCLPGAIFVGGKMKAFVLQWLCIWCQNGSFFMTVQAVIRVCPYKEPMPLMGLVWINYRTIHTSVLF